VASVPRASDDDSRIVFVGADLVDAYVRGALGQATASDARDVRIVYTPMHGVGRDVVVEVLTRAGFEPPVVVPEQAEPDPDFPTVAFPNPEEPGALDLALALAATERADVVLANDPDADRLAVAIPDGDGWRRLHGDETGALLADFLLEHVPRPERALLVTTVASSTLLSRMAAATGARYAETLTGFKWIMRAVADAPDHRLLLGYEEALGYAVSDVVRDKDGISAAVVMAQLAAQEKRAGRTLADRLDDIAARYGRHATEPVTIELEGADGAARRERIMAALRADPPRTLLGRPVTAVEDLRAGARGLPPSDVLVLRADGARVVIRPSGTEPKLKAYLEVVVDGPDKAGAAAALARLREEIAAALNP
jgi:phosphomannomutase